MTEQAKLAQGKRRARRVRKLIGWLAVLAVLGAGFFLFIWPDITAGATTTYQQYTATRGSITNAMSFSGTVSVVNNETLTSSDAATVRRIYVAEGDAVTAGERLIRLSDGTLIKASFDGEVNTLSVAEGDEVGANSSLIQIVDFNNLQVSMRVDEYSVSNVSVGQACRITVTALSQTVDSTITHINRIASGGNATAYYTVTAEFAATDKVLPGMAVTVTIPQEEASDVVILNKDALSFSNGNSAFVFLKDEAGAMQQTSVTLGVSNDKFVEITQGLAQGDTVYVAVENTAESAGGLASLFSSLSGGTTQTTQTNSMQMGPGGDFPGGGNFSGGGMGGPGNR